MNQTHPGGLKEVAMGEATKTFQDVAILEFFDSPDFRQSTWHGDNKSMCQLRPQESIGRE